MQNIQIDLKRLKQDIMCPVSLEPLTEAVSLIPCLHKVNRKAAEIIFGKTNEALGETNDEGWRTQSAQPCPTCKANVLGYAIDHLTQNVTTQVIKIRANCTNKTLMEDFNKFLEMGDLDKALGAAEAITDDKALIKIFNKFLEVEDPYKALEVAKMITDDSHLNEVLMKNFNKFLEVENLDKVLEVVEAITDDFVKNKALIKIVNKFLEIEDPYKALEVAKAIANDYYLNKALMKVFNKFLEVENLDKALETAKAITDDYLTSEVFKAISNKFLELKNANKLMMNNDDLNKTLMTILNYFLERKSLDKALEAAKAITDDSLKNEALTTISQGEVD